MAGGADSQAWLLILVLVVTNSIGLIYYLRVVTTLFHQPVVEGQGPEALPHRALTVSLVLAVLTVFLIWFGAFSSPLLHLIQSAIGSVL